MVSQIVSCAVVLSKLVLLDSVNKSFVLAFVLAYGAMAAARVF